MCSRLLRVQRWNSSRKLAELEWSTCSNTLILLLTWTMSSHNIRNTPKALRRNGKRYADRSYSANVHQTCLDTRHPPPMPNVTSLWWKTARYMDTEARQCPHILLETVGSCFHSAHKRLPRAVTSSQPARNNRWKANLLISARILTRSYLCSHNDANAWSERLMGYYSTSWNHDRISSARCWPSTLAQSVAHSNTERTWLCIP